MSGNLLHACGADNPVYARDMKHLLLLVVAVAALTLTGCKTDAGSREFIPGKGWLPMRK